MGEINKDEQRQLIERKLREKEEEFDDLKREQRNVSESFNNLHESLNQGFHRLRSLNEENIRFGNLMSRRIQQENDEKERQFRRSLECSEESLKEQYDLRARKIESETEELKLKKGSEKWD
ncbi:hypothetical protein [Xylocopilactobacillus apicola]|uniref:Uncharacterized protein n=1 Tax=Xylocopilactobacillus apicola TaxID=2932184 RepID=A0AAU9DTG8_9LACO|nr:hypothetical protein [Xylocopilactobacillus apicola]BDR59419.1 hypothetical protein XA3_18600 [Xylocopilactobacillus apicola]